MEYILIGGLITNCIYQLQHPAVALALCHFHQTSFDVLNVVNIALKHLKVQFFACTIKKRVNKYTCR